MSRILGEPSPEVWKICHKVTWDRLTRVKVTALFAALQIDAGHDPRGGRGYPQMRGHQIIQRRKFGPYLNFHSGTVLLGIFPLSRGIVFQGWGMTSSTRQITNGSRQPIWLRLHAMCGVKHHIVRPNHMHYYTAHFIPASKTPNILEVLFNSSSLSCFKK